MLKNRMLNRGIRVINQAISGLLRFSAWCSVVMSCCGSVCRNPDIATTLVSMPTVEEVHKNVMAVKEGLEICERSKDLRDIEEPCLEEVKEILKPIMNETWQQGLQENN